MASADSRARELGDDEDEELLPHDASWQWAYRLGYIIANVTVLALVTAVPRTPLRDGDLGAILSFAATVCAAVVAYFLVQGSDPGYITPDMVREDVLMQSEVELPALEHQGEKLDRRGSVSGDVNSPEAFRPVDEQPVSSEEQTATPQRQQKPCQICELVPPIRSHHCKACNRCVATFDHHCFVIGTCIGERNHCRFWWFIFLQTATLWVATGLVGESFQSGSTLNEWAKKNQLAIFASFILYVFLLYATILLGYQTWLALSSMTGYECIRGPDRLWYLRGTDDFDLPYSSTLWGNIKGFCCIRDGLCWRIVGKPWTPTQWKLPDRIDRESEDIWNHCWQNKYWSCC